MPSFSQSRKKNIQILLALTSLILSLGHFVVLHLSITLARQIDDANSGFPNTIPQWNAKQNIPFATIVGLFAAIQFISSFAIILFNKKAESAQTLYYYSLIGVLATFSIGVNLSILSSQYNTLARRQTKDENNTPTLITFYRAIILDSTVTFLFSFPVLLFICFNKLKAYFKQQRQANTMVNLNDGFGQQTRIRWILRLFLLNGLAHIAFIYNVYQFTDIQHPQDYALDSLADQYTFFIAVEIVATLATVIIQIRHFKAQFLKKNQLILLATLNAMFQLAGFTVIATKAIQFNIDNILIGSGNCFFKDCNALSTFRWQITVYSMISLLAVITSIPYFRIVQTIMDASNLEVLLQLNEIQL